MTIQGAVSGGCTELGLGHHFWVKSLKGYSKLWEQLSSQLMGTGRGALQSE